MDIHTRQQHTTHNTQPQQLPPPPPPTTTTTTSRLSQECPRLRHLWSMDLSEQPVVGAAQRRRERRLRSWLRHERMTVAMALAESTHHSSRGQKTARAGVWGHELNYTATIRKPPTPQPELFSLYDEEPGRSRPDRMPTLSGPQERDLRRTVQQIVDVPLVPLLDDPVPQMVEQLPDVLRFFDLLLPVPEQVIEVPKILLGDVPVRSVLRDPQLVEQLVEVPTVVSYSSLQRTWSIPLTFQFLVVEGDSQVFKVFFPDRVQQRRSCLRNAVLSGLWSRSLTFLVEVFKVFALCRVRQRHLLLSLQLDLMMTRMSLVKCFFALFPTLKKCEGHPALECESALGRQLIHAERTEMASSSVSPGHAGEGVFRTFPQNKKSAKWSPHSGSELSADFTSSTPAASNSWYDVELDQTWLRFVDNSGRSYWCLLRTGHSQWEPPWERRP